MAAGIQPPASPRSAPPERRPPQDAAASSLLLDRAGPEASRSVRAAPDRGRQKEFNLDLIAPSGAGPDDGGGMGRTAVGEIEASALTRVSDCNRLAETRRDSGSRNDGE